MLKLDTISQYGSYHISVMLGVVCTNHHTHYFSVVVEEPAIMLRDLVCSSSMIAGSSTNYHTKVMSVVVCGNHSVGTILRHGSGGSREDPGVHANPPLDPSFIVIAVTNSHVFFYLQ